jgi:hypothetical protein
MGTRRIFQADQHRRVWYLGALWLMDTRYPDYGPNITVIRPFISVRHMR